MAGGLGLHPLRAGGCLTRGTKVRKDLVVSRMLEFGGICSKETQGHVRVLPPLLKVQREMGRWGCSRP